jgi:hypothetical protein
MRPRLGTRTRRRRAATSPARRPGCRGRPAQGDAAAGAWLAIFLGLLSQLARLLAAAGFGTLAGLGPLAAEAARSVGWSVLACTGMAVGGSRPRVARRYGHRRAAGSSPGADGRQHDPKGHRRGAEHPQAAGTAPLWVLALKAAEYGCLAAALGWIGRRAGPAHPPTRRWAACGRRLWRRGPDGGGALGPDAAVAGRADRQRRQRAGVPGRLRAGHLRRRGPRKAPQHTTHPAATAPHVRQDRSAGPVAVVGRRRLLPVTAHRPWRQPNPGTGRRRADGLHGHNHPAQRIRTTHVGRRQS